MRFGYLEGLRLAFRTAVVRRFRHHRFDEVGAGIYGYVGHVHAVSRRGIHYRSVAEGCRCRRYYRLFAVRPAIYTAYRDGVVCNGNIEVYRQRPAAELGVVVVPHVVVGVLKGKAYGVVAYVGAAVVGKRIQTFVAARYLYRGLLQLAVVGCACGYLYRKSGFTYREGCRAVARKHVVGVCKRCRYHVAACLLGSNGIVVAFAVIALSRVGKHYLRFYIFALSVFGYGRCRRYVAVAAAVCRYLHREGSSRYFKLGGNVVHVEVVVGVRCGYVVAAYVYAACCYAERYAQVLLVGIAAYAICVL